MKAAEERGLIGDNIMGSDFSFHIKLKEGAGAFVCGEETALMQSIEGQRGMPRLRPPFPAESGLWKRPTNINNVETLAVVPWIIQNGAEAFAARGYEKSKGTKVFALAGKVNRTGLAEVPMGMTLREVIFGIGGGIKNDKAFKAVQMGGPSGGCLPESLLDLPVDYETINQTGAIVGSGGMIVIDEDNCIVDTARYFLSFTQQESCGKCPPCRIGTKRMLEIARQDLRGQGDAGRHRVPGGDGPAGQGRLAVRAGRHGAQPGVHRAQILPRGVRGARGRARSAGRHACTALITYSIDPETCTGCRACVRVCPVQAITGETKRSRMSSIKSLHQMRCLLREVPLRRCEEVLMSAAAEPTGSANGHPHPQRAGGPGAPGQTILEVARAAGVDIPTLCHDPRLEPYGACRMCLVEVEGARGPMAACGTTVTRRHEGPDPHREDHQDAQVRAGTAADQPSAGLPGVRGGRRLPAAGLRLRVPGGHGAVGLATAAGRRPWRASEHRPFRLALHPLRALRAHLPRSHVHRVLGLPQPRLRQRGRHPLPAAAAGSRVRVVRAVREHVPGGRHRRPAHAAGRPRLADHARRVTTCSYCADGCRLVLHSYRDRVVRVASETEKGPQRRQPVRQGPLRHGLRRARPTGSPRRSCGAPRASWRRPLGRRLWPGSVDKISGGRARSTAVRRSRADLRAPTAPTKPPICCRSSCGRSWARTTSTAIDHGGAGRVRGGSDGCIRAALPRPIRARTWQLPTSSWWSGANLTESRPGAGAEVIKAMRQGKTVIVVDPRDDRTGRARPSIHLAVKPGTDLAAARAMMRHLLDLGCRMRSSSPRGPRGSPTLEASLAGVDVAAEAAPCGVDADAAAGGGRGLRPGGRGCHLRRHRAGPGPAGAWRPSRRWRIWRC